MEFNINSECTVVLRERGVRAVINRYDQIGGLPPKEFKVGDKYTDKMSEIMRLFGPQCWLGMDPPIVTGKQCIHC